MAKSKSQRSLSSWSKQDWDYVSEGDKKKPKSKRGRYLPKKVRESLTASQRAATNKKKRKAGGVGSRAEYSEKVGKKVGSLSKLIKYLNTQEVNVPENFNCTCECQTDSTCTTDNCYKEECEEDTCLRECDEEEDEECCGDGCCLEDD